jgi:nickel-dependent lactate racemase
MELCPVLSDGELDSLFKEALGRALGDLERGAPIAGPAQSRGPGSVLIIPPDITRIHSRAGLVTGAACRELNIRKGWSLGAILPALGTHRPLGPEEIAGMFPRCPADTFIPHNWRDDTVELGRLEAGWVETAFSGGREQGGGPFYTDFPVQVNRILRDGPGSGVRRTGEDARPFSLIISIGQVVPHEVAGMSNHAKNIFVGTGGPDAINKSHYLGALYGLERILGRAENPVRALFDESFRRHGNLLPPVLWVLTVVDKDNAVRGFFAGFGRECFEQAAALSARVNIVRLDQPAHTIVAALPPDEYRSLWLGNKAVYRSRLAIADGGELVVLAGGVDCFGEDSGNDALIRRYGYRGAAAIRQAVENGESLSSSLSAAAHLIHGSSEGRFTIRYCTRKSGTRGFLGRKDIEGVGYQWDDLDEALKRYGLSEPFRPDASGWKKTPKGERFYFIANPALGLWTTDSIEVQERHWAHCP